MSKKKSLLQSRSLKKKIPNFKNAATERAFWETHDSTDYLDWRQAKRRVVFPNLKPSTETISLRLSQSMLDEIKRLANQRDVPYQSLIKVFLSERLRAEAQ